MIGVVVVSHSTAVAEAAASLAREMVPADSGVRLERAAGTADGGFGTDAVAIADAIQRADSGEGVLVLMDLGSAVLSAEMACEFLDPDQSARVRLSPAPLVEGLLVAAVSAASGASLDEVADEALSALSAKRDHLGAVDDDQGQPAPSPGPTTAAAGDPVTAEFEITMQHGLHARPVAQLVSALRAFDAEVVLSNATTGRGPVPATSVTKVATLGVAHGQHLAAAAVGPQAQQAIDRLAELVSDQFGEREPDTSAASAGMASGGTPGGGPAGSHLTGRQVVVGPAVVVSDDLDLSTHTPSTDEPARADRVLTDLVADLQARSQRSHGDIFAAQLALLDELATSVRDRVAAGSGVVEAVDTVFGQVAAEFDQLADPHLRDRAQDLRSLRRQLLEALLRPSDDSPVTEGEHVLVVQELDALTASSLDASLTLAVLTRAGGATGHGALVAGSRGIPVVTGQAELSVVTGDLVAVDPVEQRVWVNPSPAELDDLRRRGAERTQAEVEARQHGHEEAMTRQGALIVVKANISNLTDAQVASDQGADGSGLVRTELLFGDRATAPSAEEQAEVFIAVGRALGGRPITVRTWDAGADKPLRFIDQVAELNPFLGERGVRTMRRVPEVFDEQLRAVVLANRQTPVKVMLPMVTTTDEVLWARRRLEAVCRELHSDPVPLGMMVEVPAAAIRAGDFVDLVDFASIGTNDLTQYTAAVDRGNASVQRLARDSSEAVFDLITMTCLGLMGLPVSVCGDLASDLDAVPRLIRAGVTELSVRPSMVALVKQSVREA
ncbi:dihydroxyacetone kinase phosphoryl donor subunit DhaM [Aestuariimicrobium kwangyangense]|uniref:dihydroxyacetone kinase phosphoryl donor subunit DhaM n=1 Tax=Aestuariimicrobium kwangyangense TaxID=396389 RepID=UPI0003B6DED7|nr:dihydroxyacetone kinase phosphoryl donor subunit DhaM [Aestuariimicrobium kwangyangense]